jgi:hypothetical protein
MPDVVAFDAERHVVLPVDQYASSFLPNTDQASQSAGTGSGTLPLAAGVASDPGLVDACGTGCCGVHRAGRVTVGWRWVWKPAQFRDRT